MAVTTKLTNYFKEQLMIGSINFGLIGVNQGNPDTFKLILMDNTFTFDEDNHAFLSDVSYYALPVANGYGGAVTLNPLTVSRDDSLNRLVVSWANIQWDITDDGIRTNGAIVYDDMPDPYGEKILVGYINFGGEKVVYNEGVFTITNGKIILA